MYKNDGKLLTGNWKLQQIYICVVNKAQKAQRKKYIYARCVEDEAWTVGEAKQRGFFLNK